MRWTLVSVTRFASSIFLASSFFYSQAESTPDPAPQPAGQVRERRPLGGSFSITLLSKTIVRLSQEKFMKQYLKCQTELSIEEKMVFTTCPKCNSSEISQRWSFSNVYV
jgi:predicted RNA-binding Zn-ribbon protein involved in translation (DUF1610 family)